MAWDRIHWTEASSFTDTVGGQEFLEWWDRALAPCPPSPAYTHGFRSCNRFTPSRIFPTCHSCMFKVFQEDRCSWGSPGAPPHRPDPSSISPLENEKKIPFSLGMRDTLPENTLLSDPKWVLSHWLFFSTCPGKSTLAPLGGTLLCNTDWPFMVNDWPLKVQFVLHFPPRKCKDFWPWSA